MPRPLARIPPVHLHNLRIPALVIPTPVPRPHTRVEARTRVRSYCFPLVARRIAADVEGPACAAALGLVAVDPEGGEGTCGAAESVLAGCGEKHGGGVERVRRREI